MKGKTVVATGATSGIGERAVESLARQGARIVFIARDARRAEATRGKLEAIAPGLGHRSLLADLSLMADAKRVGAEIAASEPRVDVLINNAGAIFTQRRVTSEGLEMTFALNHMAYFVLDPGAAGAAERLGAGARRLDRLGRPFPAPSSISTTCKARRTTAASRPTAARSSPTSFSPANSRAGSQERASSPIACTPASSPRVSATRPAAGSVG